MDVPNRPQSEALQDDKGLMDTLADLDFSDPDEIDSDGPGPNEFNSQDTISANSKQKLLIIKFS